MKTKALNIILVIFSFILLCACDNNKTVPADTSPDINPELYSITIGAVVDNSIYAIIPLEIYGGTESDLNNTTLDIYFNGSLLTANLETSQFYKSSTNDVRLAIQPVTAEKVLGFLIHKSDSSTLYYEGTISQDNDSQANLTVIDTPDPTNQDILDLFDEKQSATGNGTGTSFSGDYLVTFGTFTFSNECTTDFLKSTGYYINDPDFYDNTDLTDEEIDSMIANGAAGFEILVDLSQTDSTFTWEPYNSTTPAYTGIINADNTWSIFDGNYQDESNYTYKTIEGSTDTQTESFSGTLTEILTLNSTSSCTVTSEFSGIKW